MEAHTEDGRVVVGGDARQRFYDARGYGYPLEGNRIALSEVEAAHLLLRGDLASVDDRGLEAYLSDVGDRVGLRFLVYLDLRERGFYLSPARADWVDDPPDDVDFVVYSRGTGPEDDAVAYHVRVVGERARVPATELVPDDVDGTDALAVVDEESEVTYLETGQPSWDGETSYEPDEPAAATLIGDRALCWSPPAGLYESAFYGQPLGQRDEGAAAIQLSLVETAQLVAAGVLSVDGGYDAVVERGRRVEGDRFDRRLQVYAALRERGVVPKTGFKFGADFRTYADVDSVDDLGHSERLVRVLPPDHEFDPRDVALDVRLAHGVRKQLVVAWPSNGQVEWCSIERLTP